MALRSAASLYAATQQAVMDHYIMAGDMPLRDISDDRVDIHFSFRRNCQEITALENHC